MGNKSSKKQKLKPEKVKTIIGLPRNFNDLSPRTHFQLFKKLPDNFDATPYFMQNLIDIDNSIGDLTDQQEILENRLHKMEEKIVTLQRMMNK